MGYMNNKGTEVTFRDMDGNEVMIGMRIYPPSGGRELRVAWFQPDFPDLGDVLMCQQVEDLDAFSPITVKNCTETWKIKTEE